MLTTSVVVYRFGPFELDRASRRLSREQQPVHLSSPQFAILDHLIAHAGDIVSREALIQAAWGRAAINDNSLEKAISDLRKIVGARAIETCHTQGYRLSVSVSRADRIVGDTALEAQLAPFGVVVRGRQAVVTFDRDAIERSLQELEQAVRQEPDCAEAYVQLAIARGLAFAATVPGARRDPAALKIALEEAQQACRRDATSGKAWSTLAFLLYLGGDAERAASAACKAFALEPKDWRHALCAAYVSWGDERLRATQRIRTLRPGLALTHWLDTTVFIARDLLEVAAEEIRLGCAAQDAQIPGSRFPAVGMHLLHGLWLAEHDRLDEAVAALNRELSSAQSTHLYARECEANTWYALGAVYLRQRKRADAEAAFTRALAIAPRHVSATAALRREVPASARDVDRALGEALVLALGNRHRDAARVYREAVAQAPPGIAGWMLPVEPLLHPHARPDVWADALALVRIRAT